VGDDDILFRSICRSNSLFPAGCLLGDKTDNKKGQCGFMTRRNKRKKCDCWISVSSPLADYFDTLFGEVVRHLYTTKFNYCPKCGRKL